MSEILRPSPFPYRRLNPAGARYYDFDEIVKHRGYDPEEHERRELMGPRGNSRKFDDALLRQPIIPTYVPPRFDYYGLSEIIAKHPIIMPTIFGKGQSSIVSFLLINKMRELGFNDFVTYPVRVYLLEMMDDFDLPFNEIEKNFPYRDDLFIAVQLTNPLFSLLEPRVAGEPLDESRITRKSDQYYIRRDYEEVDYPLFFRIEHSTMQLYCNMKAALAFNFPEFYGITLD